MVYSLSALAGAVAAVELVWDLASFVIAAMLFINLYGLLMLLPKVRVTLLEQLRNYRA